MPGRTTRQDESGWYYHTPFVNPKTEKAAPKPPMSQIPGINGCQEQRAAGSTRPYYRDTDSKYVRLAKQGGTKNLLNYEEFDQHKDAVAYHRNEWYYSEDNAIEDLKTRKDESRQYDIPENVSNTQCGLESGDQSDELQKLESLKMADNEPISPDTPTSPNKGQPATDSSTDDDSPKEPTHLVIHGVDHERPERSQMAKINSPNYNIERVKAYMPEQEFKNPILQNDFYHSQEPTGYSRKHGSDSDMDICNSLPAGYTKKQWSDKDGAGVSMSKLLSHTYGTEWHVQNTHPEIPKKVQSQASKDFYQSESNRSQACTMRTQHEQQQHHVLPSPESDEETENSIYPRGGNVN